MISILIVVFAAFLFPREVNAYLDPGSGSYLFQILIGSLLAIGFTIRNVWGKGLLVLKNMINKRRKTRPDE
jgi:hypothetical protein